MSDLEQFDAADYLGSEAMIAEYLSAALEDENPDEFMQRRLALLEGLSKGERAILEGKTISHDEARKRMQKWLK